MFSASEEIFLKRQGIPFGEVLDVRGLRPVVWKPYAKLKNKPIVLRDPRPTCEHRLATRSNSCCICRPSSIAHQNRHRNPGWVYLAFSPSLCAVKVGCSADLSLRVSHLNQQGYAGVSDWEICENAFVAEMGRVEAMIIEKMPGDRVRATYSRRLSGETCKEVFNTSLRAARKVFVKVIKDLND